MSVQHLLLAGDHLELLYAREQTLLQEKQAQSQEVLSIDLAKSSETEILEILGTQSMFASQRLIQVRGGEKLRSPKQLQMYIDALAVLSDDILAIWPVQLTAAKKKNWQAGNFKVEEFKFPAVLFQFLEGIGTLPMAKCFALYEEALRQSGEWSLHALVARQFRLLLAAKTAAPILAPPFTHRKLESQARPFTEQQLADALHQLFQVEYAIKSGTTKLGWSQQFDILLTKLYAGRVG